MLSLLDFETKLSECLSRIDTPEGKTDITGEVLQDNLKSEEFVLDCMERQLGYMKNPVRMSKFRGLFVDPQGQFRGRLIFWPPKYSTPAHEHKFWTVAGVLMNRVEGTVYESLDSRIEIRNFSGTSGEVGRLFPPCVHQLRNSSENPSVSLHIFGRDPDPSAEPGSDRAKWESKTAREAARNKYRAGIRQRAEFSMVEIIAMYKSERSTRLLDVLAKIGSEETKRAVSTVRA